MMVSLQENPAHIHKAFFHGPFSGWLLGEEGDAALTGH